MEETLSKAERDVVLLREALSGLLGARSEAELRQLEAITRMISIPEEDKQVSLRAIRALLETM